MDRQGVDYLYEAKVLFVGEGGAGKTSLLRRLYYPELELPGEYESTRGIEVHRQEFRRANGGAFRLNLWDFGGQQIYHAWIITFFKQVQVEANAASHEAMGTVVRFQKKLGELGHFWTKYDSIEHLKLLFKDQLERLGA
jgi:GTPase SAR1 family protein